MSEEAAKYTAPNIKAKAAQIAPPAEPHNQPGDLIIGEPGAPADVRLGMRLVGDDELATVTITQRNKTTTLAFTDSAHAARIADALLGYQPYAVVVSRKEAEGERPPAPAVQGEPIPAGFALIKLDSRTGKPLVTSEMKAKHIGEYWWDEEAPYYDEHGDLHDYVARHAVPWSLCKEIYKNMASTAMLSAQPADQQPAPDVTQLVEALRRIADLPIGPCSTENDYRLSAAKAFAAGVLAAHRKQGGES